MFETKFKIYFIKLKLDNYFQGVCGIHSMRGSRKYPYLPPTTEGFLV